FVCHQPFAQSVEVCQLTTFVVENPVQLVAEAHYYSVFWVLAVKLFQWIKCVKAQPFQHFVCFIECKLFCSYRLRVVRNRENYFFASFFVFHVRRDNLYLFFDSFHTNRSHSALSLSWISLLIS